MDVTDIIEGKCGSRIIVGPVKYLVKYDANGGSVSNLTTTNGGTIIYMQYGKQIIDVQLEH